MCDRSRKINGELRDWSFGRCVCAVGRRVRRAGSYLRLELSIEFLMSFRESVKDLNSNEFRSPPSARHCIGEQNPQRNESVVTV